MSTMDATIPSPVSTSARWRLVGLMLAMVGAAHFNRISISVAGAGAIIDREGISATEMGFVYSAYLFLYTFAMSPGGWLIDRFGPWLGLFVVGAGSSVFVLLTGFAGVLWTGMPLLIGLLAIRSLMGVVNAPTHPGSARLVGNWIPPSQQSFVNGAVNFAACVGMSTTYLLFGFLMDEVGWTGASFIAAGVTLVLAFGWWTFASSHPPHVSNFSPLPVTQAAQVGDEGTEVRAGSPPQPQPLSPEYGGEGSEQGSNTPIDVSTSSMAALFCNRNMIFLTLSYGALGYFQYLFFYWAEYYFTNERHLPKHESRLFTSILTLAMGLGMLAGGWLTDWMATRLRHRHAFAVVPVLGLTCSAFLLVPGFLSDSPIITLVCFGLAMAAAGTSEGAFWTLAVSIGGSRGGLAAGILNTGGNAGGLVAPVLTPIISAWLGWQAGLGLAGVICLLGAACWIGIDPRQRLTRS